MTNIIKTVNHAYYKENISSSRLKRASGDYNVQKMIASTHECIDVFCFVYNINKRNHCVADKLLSQGFHDHNLLKTFTKLFHRYNDLVCKFNCNCTKLISYGRAYP